MVASGLSINAAGDASGKVAGMFTLPATFSIRRAASVALLGVIAFSVSGCMLYNSSQRHQSTSVVQFLYPGKDSPYIMPTTPTLRLPLRVGLAFVPSAQERGNYAYVRPGELSEMRKSDLLREVSAQFRALPFVQSIEVVPSTYLRPNGGFQNLDQIRALMGVDVIALVAYDQAQVTTETPWSLAYWTIIGAYVVPAQKNDTHTLMEAVVYDIESRSLLFRAPGVSFKKANSTLVTTDDYLRQASAESYADATRDLTANLQRELELFKVRAKEQPESVKIEHRAGYTGGGELDWGVVMVLGVIAGGLWLSRRTRA